MSGPASCDGVVGAGQVEMLGQDTFSRLQSPFPSPTPIPSTLPEFLKPPFCSFLLIRHRYRAHPCISRRSSGPATAHSESQREELTEVFHCPPSNLSRACEPQSTPSGPPHEPSYPGCALHHPCDHHNYNPPAQQRVPHHYLQINSRAAAVPGVTPE